MSAQRRPAWRERAVRSLGPAALKRPVKELVKSLLSGLVRQHPATAFRLAEFMEHTATGHVRRKARLAAIAASAGAEATRLPKAASRAALVDVLAKADATLDHATVLGLFAELGQLEESTLHRYLTALFVARRLDVMEHVVSTDALGYPATRLFHRIKLRQYQGLTPPSVAAALADHAALAGHSLFSEAAVNLTLDGLVRIGDASALALFLQDVLPAEFARVAPATFFGCFRLLQQAGQADACERWRRAFLNPLSLEQRLYHLELMAPASPLRQQAQAGWRGIARTFARAYSAADVADRAFLNDQVLAPLLSLPEGERDALNIRFDDGERQRLFAKVEMALRQRQPLSLVRLGDGEGYGYAIPAGTGLDAAGCREDNLVRERMWWGSTIDDAARIAVTGRFRAAVATADIIGIPSIYRLVRDRSTPGSRFGETGAQRGLAVVLSHLGGAIPLDRMLTEERCHQLLFSRPAIEQLAAQAERVVLVSCWRREQLSLTARDVREVVIPPHTKVAGLASGSTAGGEAGASLAHRYEALVSEMAAHCAPGTLVLVGAGFIGKIFCAEAQARGAIALDVGAMLDYFAGYKTRSLADLG
jgi:hypothetical protein